MAAAFFAIAVVSVVVLLYEIVGLYFLVLDRQVVEGCSVERGIVWSVTLWHYILASLIFAPLGTFLILRLPHRRMAESVDLHCRRWNLDEPALREHFRHDEKTSNKFGFTASMPDWLFMAMGTVMLFVAMVLALLAFWGHSQLFVLRTQCKDISIAFKEIGLWRFGLLTFVLQVILGGFLALCSLLFLAAPFCLEATLPPRRGGNARGCPFV